MLVTQLRQEMIYSPAVLGSTTLNMVLPVMHEICDIFYHCHQQSGMLDDALFVLGLGVDKKWLIVMHNFKLHGCKE
jgi:hypothetical protein